MDTQFKTVKPPEDNENILSKAQVENWRRILLNMIGPYSLWMPVEEIQAIRDRMQERVNRED